MMSKITYQAACRQRTFAEQCADPEAFDRAAAMFRGLAMEASARRCQDRANHYRAVAMETAEMECAA